MAAMRAWNRHRLGADVPVVLVPSADIEGMAIGGTTTALVAGFSLYISLIRGVPTCEVFTGGVSTGASSWLMSRHLIMKLSDRGRYSASGSPE
jgi:hypothetical protein